MLKFVGTNSILLVGKAYEFRLHFLSIQDKTITLADYIKNHAAAYKNSFN